MLNRVDFPFIPGSVPTLLNLRCGVFNLLDEFAQRFGGGVRLPGDELDARQACFQFIRFKDTLDQTLEPPENSYRRFFKFTTPDGYVSLMLPGIRFEYDCADVTEKIDPEEVIGCSWQQHSPPADPEAVMDKLNRPHLENMDRAAYGRLGDLPLYIAGEGKNRVELFRRHRRMIDADVRRKFVSKAPVVCRDLSGQQWLSSWRNEHNVLMFAVVPFPSISLPIYRLLGVEIRSERVPVERDDTRRSLRATIHHLTEAVAVP